MIALNPEGLESKVIDQNWFQIRNFEWILYEFTT